MDNATRALVKVKLYLYVDSCYAGLLVVRRMKSIIALEEEDLSTVIDVLIGQKC
jgi:hypothetical protein